MSKCLRKVTQRRPSVRVYFFGEQTEIVRSPEQTFEQAFGFIDLASPGQIIDPPEGADRKSAFPAVHSVIPMRVTVDEVAADQLLDDAVIGRRHPGIADLSVAETSHLQHRDIEAIAAKLARVAVSSVLNP